MVFVLLDSLTVLRHFNNGFLAIGTFTVTSTHVTLLPVLSKNIKQKQLGNSFTVYNRVNLIKPRR